MAPRSISDDTAYIGIDMQSPKSRVFALAVVSYLILLELVLE